MKRMIQFIIGIGLLALIILIILLTKIGLCGCEG